MHGGVHERVRRLGGSGAGYRRAPWSLGALLLILLIPALSEEQTRDELRGALAEVRELRDLGRWEKARALLAQALEQHGDEEYAALHWYEIQDNLKRCSFWAGYQRPEPAHVVPGKLQSWKSSSGAIKLRYEQGELRVPEEGQPPRGFELVDGFAVHPMVFTGPYTIEFEATPTGEDGFAILVDWSRNPLDQLNGRAGQNFGFHSGPDRLYGAMRPGTRTEGRRSEGYSVGIKKTRRDTFKVSVTSRHGHFQWETSRSRRTHARGIRPVRISRAQRPWNLCVWQG